MKNIMLVALGGAAGSVARYLLSKAIQDTAATAFPWGTMAVNVAGCLLIGLLYGLAAGDGTRLGADLKLMLTVGFCGGFTTFSTFANESLTLAKSGDALLSAAYIGSSVALGVLAVAAGAQLAKAFAS
ncbi:MAG TPA: fluoride efflux transporter CrcB [Candidatus Prevotella stercoripullorum]|nr:fluoride efflux transporter CrcB [Candidatus Prevotella stercoripullorum]